MANPNTSAAAGPSVSATPNTRLLNEHEAAQELGLKVATLRRWRWAGKPPRFLKIGAAVRYDPAELSALIKAARRTSTADTGGNADGR
jgi:predicted DNA-binding transcriptional regulator AlpA